ncbi:MAG: transposase [Phycisphaerales bacterium]|nr:transposase [Phycisphaerales bacterium]
MLRRTNARGRLLKEPPKFLDSVEQGVVARVIGEILAPGMPGAMWRVYAAAIQETHVHLLLAPMRDDIGAVVGRIKSNTSSAVLALHHKDGRARTWTAGYWKVFLFDVGAVHTVAAYIQRHGDNRSPYTWVRPPT